MKAGLLSPGTGTALPQLMESSEPHRGDRDDD
jgi:hypothetical protein